MVKTHSKYVCQKCGRQTLRYMGRCPGCSQFNTMVEEIVEQPRLNGSKRTVLPYTHPETLDDITTENHPRMAVPLGEFNRVMGGGIVPGSITLIGGEPGIGKSTLCLQLALAIEERGGKVLYVTGEESLEQVRLRAVRLGALGKGVLALAETRVEALAKPWRDAQPTLVLIDSIQTLRTERVESAPGSVAQVRECAALLAATAKTHGTALVLVGHVTKEGTLAGPRVLEHLVDVVLSFEGERGHPFRLLRATKNRFGSTQEVGVFTMGERGLDVVENPSELFLAERHAGAPGSCIVPVLEGSRPMLLEVQALVAPAGYGTARRTCLGIDDARVALLLAVLDRRSDVDLLSRDVYVNVAGGVRVAEPAADLAVALALASSRLDLPLPADVAACGEIGLGGEIRRVARLEERLREAARLGYGRVLVPARALPLSAGDATPIGVDDVGEAVTWLRRNVHAA
jgi:DNA repair protein RadA/Sms